MTSSDVERLLHAVAEVAATEPPVHHVQDPGSGHWWPAGRPRPDGELPPLRGCERG